MDQRYVRVSAVRIVVITGSADPVVPQEALAVGAEAFLQKPESF